MTDATESVFATIRYGILAQYVNILLFVLFVESVLNESCHIPSCFQRFASFSNITGLLINDSSSK